MRAQVLADLQTELAFGSTAINMFYFYKFINRIIDKSVALKLSQVQIHTILIDRYIHLVSLIFIY